MPKVGAAEIRTQQDVLQFLKDELGYRYLGHWNCLLYTSPSPRDLSTSRMPSSA